MSLSSDRLIFAANVQTKRQETFPLMHLPLRRRFAHRGRSLPVPLPCYPKSRNSPHLDRRTAS